MHALLRQAARLDALALELNCDVGDLPLFPDALGRHVPKSAAVATIVELPKLYGVPVSDAFGSRLFGGHSLRTGGASFLASRGINPYKIQALGRWRSPLVIHYAGAAMASGLAADLVRAGAAAPDLNSSPSARCSGADPVDRHFNPGPLVLTPFVMNTGIYV